MSGCDSIITINLTIVHHSEVNKEYYVCQGDTFIAPDGQIYTSSGNYTATISNSAGCDSIIHFNLYFVHFEATITVNNNTLIASPEFIAYQWLDCDNSYTPIPGAINMTFTPTHSGNYAVYAYSMTCSDTSDCIHFTLQDVHSNILDDIIIYPNPIGDKFVINFGEASNESYYEIFNSLGQLVVENKLLPMTYVDAKMFEKGVYLVKIIHQNKVFYKKLIKN